MTMTQRTKRSGLQAAQIIMCCKDVRTAAIMATEICHAMTKTEMVTFRDALKLPDDVIFPPVPPEAKIALP